MEKMRHWTTLVLLTICYMATGQTSLAKKSLTFFPGTYIDTEYRFTEADGMDVIVQNSLRKGGQYIDPTGKDFFSVIYWYRIINESRTPFELIIYFPADSFPNLKSLDAYLKVFLPPDTMDISKEGLYAYGATGLNTFLDTGLNNPTQLKRTIKPKESHLFYIGALYYQAFAPSRAELVIKGQEVYYKIGGIEILCGKISLINNNDKN